MTFKLAINPFFWAPVKVSLVGDMGARVEGSFKAKYRRLSQEEYEALLARMRLPVRPIQLPAEAIDGEGGAQGASSEPGDIEGQLEPITQWRITDKEVLDLVLLDWDDLLDEQDQKIAYTPDSLERMETILGVRASLVQGFFDAHVKAPEKNSGTRRGASTS
jgi:hypothetical protein